ncbi:MAG TPA: hypothetical protein VFO14_24810, partial [Vicinamibacterales bacterium]|nr:hypothetical protein [Vicinamibacterales bacterium]
MPRGSNLRVHRFIASIVSSRGVVDARLSPAFHNYDDVSDADASRLAALLVGHMRPACSLL